MTSVVTGDAPVDSVRGLAQVEHLVGRTPTMRIGVDRPELARFFLKLEGCNPTGSVKDRAAFRMINAAVTSARFESGVTLLDASSGNMACALAYFAARLNLPATVVVSSKLTAEKRWFLEYFGASIVVVGDRTIDGNDYCRVLAAADAEGRYLFLDQLHNWNNPAAHYATTGPEILAAHPDCRMVVGSLGSGGTLYGTAKYLKERVRDLIVVAVEASAGSKMPGVGGFDDGDYMTPFIEAGRREKLFDVSAKVSLEQAAAQLLAGRRDGLFGGLQTGAVVRAAYEAARERDLDGDVVIIAGDTGWKNVQSLASARSAFDPSSTT
ncbi:MAG: PLP-dependent cysteine synthase family protein [Gemmatimonadaceae bacterium]